MDADAGMVYVATWNQAQIGKPWLFVCTTGGTDCKDHDISNRQGTNSGGGLNNGPSLALDADAGMVYVATWNQAQNGKPWLFVCTTGGTDCKDHDISNGQGTNSGGGLNNGPSLVLDAGAGMVYVATKNGAQDGKPWLFVCTTGGTDCKDYNISNGQGQSSGNNPSSALDADAGMVYVATQNGARDNKPWLFVCTTGGNDCKDYDISNGQGQYSGSNPSLALDADAGMVYVATTNGAQDQKPWLFVCTTGGNDCKDYDISNGQGQYSGNNPSLALDADAGMMYVATKNVAQNFKPWLFVCTTRGTDCMDYDISNGQGTNSGLYPSLALDADAGMVYVATTNFAQNFKPWLFATIPFSFATSYITPPSIPTIGANNTFTLHIRGAKGSMPHIPSTFPLASALAFTSSPSIPGTVIQLNSTSWTFEVSLDLFASYKVDAFILGASCANSFTNLALDPSASQLVDVSALSNLAFDTDYSFHLQLRSQNGNQIHISLSYDFSSIFSVLVDVSFGSVPSINVTQAIPGTSDAIFSFNYPNPFTALSINQSLAITITQVPIHGLPFQADFIFPLSPSKSFWTFPPVPTVGAINTFTLRLVDLEGKPFALPPVLSVQSFFGISLSPSLPGNLTKVDDFTLTYSVDLSAFAQYSLSSKFAGTSGPSTSFDISLDSASCALLDFQHLTDLVFDTPYAFNLTLRNFAGHQIGIPESFDYTSPSSPLAVRFNPIAFNITQEKPGLSDVLIAFTYPSPPDQASKKLSLFISVNGLPIPKSPFNVFFSSRGACRPGTYIPGTCVPCSLGTFSSTTNAANCTFCNVVAPHTTTLAKASTSLSNCVCEPGAFTLSNQTGVACKMCKDGGVCPGNTALPYAAPGFYSSTNLAYFIPCGVSQEEGEERCKGHDECERAYTSRLCSQCAPNYFASDESCHKCKGQTGPSPLIALLVVIAIFLATLFWLLLSEAADSSSNPHHHNLSHPPIPRSGIRWLWGWIVHLWREALLMLTELAALVVLTLFGLRETFEVVVLGIAFVILTTYLTISRIVSLRVAFSTPSSSPTHNNRDDADPLHEPLMIRDLRAQSSSALSELAEEEIETHVLHVESIIKVMIIYLQTLSAILSTFSVEWTGSMRMVGATLEKTSLKISGLECNGLGFEGQFYFSLLLVPGVLSLIVVVAGLIYVNLVFRNQSSRPLLTMALKMVLAAGYFFFYPVAARCLSMFSCIPEPIPDPSASYLGSAPWIRCGSPTHTHLAATSGFVLGVLALLSVGLSWMVRKWRHSHTSVVGSAVGFLHESYRESVWWFESAVLARRVAIAAFVSILPRGSIFVAPFLLFTLLGSVTMVFVKRPFQSPAAHQLEVATLLASISSLVVVQNMSLTHSESSLALSSALFIGANGAVLAAAGVYLILPLFALASSLGTKRGRSWSNRIQ